LSFDVGASTGCCGATCAAAPAHHSVNARAAVIALCIRIFQGCISTLRHIGTQTLRHIGTQSN
jgi:hypothetical protein